jgi:hypothetical protein
VTILYIAGPMTGLPEFNRPAFFTAAEHLNDAGYVVVNPARRDVDPAKTWADYMRDGIRDVLDVEGVAVLDGWEGSRGARLEVAVAHALGMPVRYVSEWIREATA